MEKPIENPHDISLKFHFLISAKLKTMPPKSHYHKLRQKYLPPKIKFIFLLESPPISGDYFYDSDGWATEQLFSAMMKIIN